MQICAKFAQLIFSPKSTLICAAFAQLAMCIKVQFMTQPFACRQEKSTVTQKTLNPYFFVPSSRETELLLSSEDNQREKLAGGWQNLKLGIDLHGSQQQMWVFGGLEFYQSSDSCYCILFSILQSHTF